MLRTDIKDNKILAKKVPNGYYEMEIKRKRNPKFHKKYWALLDFVLFHLPEAYEYTVYLGDIEVARYHMESTEMLHRFFKFMLHIESISFAKMDQTKFEQFYKNCINLTCRILGTQTKDVLEQVLEFEYKRGYFG